MSRALIAMAFCAVALYGQNKTPSPNPKPVAKTEAIKPAEQNVQFRSWDDGELKDCLTYSGQPHLLICDGNDLDWEESFLTIIGNNAGPGISEKQDYDATFSYIWIHSKHFIVGFSEEPWPKPQTGIDLSIWHCAKDKTITCKRQRPKEDAK